MSRNEELLTQYLRLNAGRYLPYCEVLNRVTDTATEHKWRRVDRNTWRTAWMGLRSTLDGMIRRGKVIRRQHRRVRGRSQTVRLHEAFVRNPFYNPAT